MPLPTVGAGLPVSSIPLSPYQQFLVSRWPFSVDWDDATDSNDLTPDDVGDNDPPDLSGGVAVFNSAEQQFASVPTNANIQFGDNHWTVLGWFRPATLPNMIIVSNFLDANRGFAIRIADSGGGPEVAFSAPRVSMPVGLPTLTANQWVLAMMNFTVNTTPTADNAQFRYKSASVDEQRLTLPASSDGPTPNTTNALTFGATPGLSSFFNGALSDWRIYIGVAIDVQATFDAVYANGPLA